MLGWATIAAAAACAAAGAILWEIVRDMHACCPHDDAGDDQ